VPEDCGLWVPRQNLGKGQKIGLKTGNLEIKPISKPVYKAETGMRVGPKADGT
jgi:hypothetical protein